MQARRVVVELGQRHNASDLHDAAGERFGIGDLTAAAGEVARNVTHVAFGGGDFDRDDWFEHLRFGLFESVEERLAACGDKGDFLRVDRVALSVVDNDAKVLQRIASCVARGEHFSHALFYGRNQVVGDGAALNLIDEFEARAARQRFDAQIHFAELAGAARLLLVACMPFGLCGDRFAVRNRRCRGFDFKLEVDEHALENRADMHVGQAADHRFVQNGVVFDDHRRVFGLHLLEHFAHAAFIAAAGGLDGKAVHGFRECDRTHVNASEFRVAVNDRAVTQFVDLGDGADVTRAERVGFSRILALQNERMRSLDALLAVVDVDDGVLLHRALMHAEDTDLADVRVVDDLEDLSDERQILVGYGLVGRAVGIEEERVVGFGRTRQMANDHLHEVADADEVLRGGKADGDHMAFAQCLRNERMEQARVNVTFLEILLEHLIVFFDDALDEGTVHVLNAHDVRFTCVAVEAVDHAGAVLGRKVDRQNAGTPGFTKFFEQFFEIRVGRVALIDDNHAAEVALIGRLHHADCEEFRTLRGVNDGCDGFDGIKRREVLTKVVGIARGVEHVNAYGREVGHGRVDMRHGKANRVLNLLFERVVVAHGVAALDAAEFGNHAGTVEHGFDEGSLAAGAVPYQRQSTKSFSGIVAHMNRP